MAAGVQGDKLPGSVLFVCSLNQIRSPIAEHLYRKRYGKASFAQSAGIDAGGEDGFMQAVMAEVGIDASNHEPVKLDEIEDTYVDLIITLTPEVDRRTREIMRDKAVEIELWAMDNPAQVLGSREVMLDAYRNTRDTLEKLITDRFG